MIKKCNKVFLENNFLSKNKCKELITFYNNSKSQNKFNTTFTLKLHLEEHSSLIKKLNKRSLELNNSVVDYINLVKWPCPNLGKDLHFDTAHKRTNLSSIIYLNDNYLGGNTFFKDGTSFSSVTGRAIFFDGKYFKHGVSNIINNDRYTLAIWFK
jgi:hypothetical protein|tara:strand:- start:244 stop:708 length:465 start_codon:yes stop_codon:yes gene_type:complete